MKMSFYYSRKISIFSKGLNHDSGQKFQLSFEPTSKRDPGFYIINCRLMIFFPVKEAF